MVLRYWKNPDNGTEITLEKLEENKLVLWYKDDKHPRYWETFFTPYTSYPSYHRVMQRLNISLMDYAINEFNTVVLVQQDGINIRAMVRKYEERCWAEQSSLEDLPLVMPQMKSREALDIVMKRLTQEG